MFKTILMPSIILLLNGQSDNPRNTSLVEFPNHLAVTCSPSNQSKDCNCTTDNTLLMNQYSALLPRKNDSKGCSQITNLLFDQVTTWLSSEKENLEQQNIQKQSSTSTPQTSCDIHLKFFPNPTMNAGHKYVTLLDFIGNNGCVKYHVSCKIFYDDHQHKIVDWIVPNTTTGIIKFIPQPKHKGKHTFRVETYLSDCTHVEYFSITIVVSPRNKVIHKYLLASTSSLVGLIVGLGLVVCSQPNNCFRLYFRKIRNSVPHDNKV